MPQLRALLADHEILNPGGEIWERKGTLISMLPTFCEERTIGRPTTEGKMCAGKLDPA
jgi:hypothetical protein